MNIRGQVGPGRHEATGRHEDSRRDPGTIAGLGAVREVSLGDLHACALLLDGTVRCWGDNLNAQLGDGTRVFREEAVSVLFLGDTGPGEVGWNRP